MHFLILEQVPSSASCSLHPGGYILPLPEATFLPGVAKPGRNDIQDKTTTVQEAQTEPATVRRRSRGGLGVFLGEGHMTLVTGCM